MDGHDIAVREATRADSEALQELLGHAGASILRGDASVDDLLSSGVTLVGAQGARLVCALGCMPQNAVVAHLGCVSMTPPWTAEGCIRLLFPSLLETLRKRRFRFLVHTAVETWLLPVFRSEGFGLSTHVVSYQLDSMTAPDLPACPARIVPPPADQRGVSRVDREAFPVEWHYGERAIRNAHETAAHFRVAEIDGRIVGYAFGSLHGRACHLTRLAVLSEFCGRGIGSALLAHAITDLASQGAQWMTLNTQVDNARSQRLYQAFGFRRVGTSVPFLCQKLGGAEGGQTGRDQEMPADEGESPVGWTRSIVPYRS